MEKILKQKLIDLVGKKYFSDKLIDLVAYSKDASEHRHRPMGAVWPQNSQQVSDILKLANQEGLPIVPRLPRSRRRWGNCNDCPRCPGTAQRFHSASSAIGSRRNSTPTVSAVASCREE